MQYCKILFKGVVLYLPNAIPHVVVTPNNKITFIVIEISDFVLNHNENVFSMVLGYLL